LELAQEKGLDLIEIAPNVQPPVCRIMDYGKYQYQKSREERQQRTKQKKVEIKGIRISFRTSQHDLETKAKQANKFLDQGHKIRIEMILRGREKALLAMAKEKLNEFIKLVSPEINIEQEIKKQPRGLTVVVAKQ
jgi:translation initiation factor IF-3